MADQPWPDGKPAVDAEVNLLCPSSNDPAGFAIEDGPTTTKTDSNGFFRIEGFTGENYWVEARAQKPNINGVAEYFYSPDQPVKILADTRDLTLTLSKSGNGGGCSK